MPIDTRNERLSIMGWPRIKTMWFPDGDLDKEDRHIALGLPAVDVAPPEEHAGRPKMSFSLGYIGLGG